jgi:hypothetical protein
VVLATPVTIFSNASPACRETWASCCVVLASASALRPFSAIELIDALNSSMDAFICSTVAPSAGAPEATPFERPAISSAIRESHQHILVFAARRAGVFSLRCVCQVVA